MALAKYVKYIIDNDLYDFSKILISLNLSKLELLEKLKAYPKKTTNLILQYYPNLQDDIDILCKDLFSTYDKFYIIGCPDSTDIDVLCFVDKKYLNNANILSLSKMSIDNLKKELSLLGYDLSKNLDINLMVFEDGRSIGQSKGGLETLNILKYTYHLHKQAYPLDFEIHHVEVTNFDKLRAISKFMLDYLEDVAIDYKSIRSEKREIYMSGITNMIKYSVKLIDYFDFDKRTMNWYDFMKSITMKLLQLIILQDNLYIYTKKDLVEISSNYNLDKNSIAYLLYRGKIGNFNKSDFIKMFDFYKILVNKYFDDFNHIDFTIKKDSIINQTLLSDILFSEFIKSPNSHTELFEHHWKDYDVDDINSLFEFLPTNIQDINLDQKILDKHFIQVPQRSQEWLELQEFYKTGTNNGNIKQTMEGFYNIIRGAITENILLNMINPDDFNIGAGWKKVIPGLLVKEKMKGALGCSPDLLLIKDKKVIPVEIKTMTSLVKNSDYYNKYELAQKQLSSVSDILGKDIVVNNIIIIACWINDELIYEVFVY